MKNILNGIDNYLNYITGVIIFYLQQKRFILPFFFSISYLLFYFLIDFSSQNLVAHDEGLYARRSRLVEESYNWFNSPFDNPHHKTLGSYWLIALSIRLFGNSELSLRLPSILCSFICLFIIYKITVLIVNKKSAFLAVCSLSSMPLWIQYSRYASPDLPFVLCIMLVIYFFLKYINSSLYSNKYFYIFSAGLFISISFFVRSYMAFVPLIGLMPFFIFYLSKSSNKFRSLFATGILFGSIPTFLNLYFAYKKFGLNGITSLFDFAKKQAIGSISYSNFLIIPVKYFYFTFPIGVLFIFFLVFTKTNTKIKYPLLVYLYPCFSLVLLCCMSTSYPHYYLYLLPSLSILFAANLESFAYRFPLSKNITRLLFFLIIVLVSSILIALTFYANNYLLDLSYKKTLLLSTLSILLVLSYVSCLRFVFDFKTNSLNVKKIFFCLIIPQYSFLSLLYGFGIIGNPNFHTKSFLNDKLVSSIAISNTIYLYNVESKIQTLLSFYLPSSEVVKSINDINMYKYLITSNSNNFNSFEEEANFKSIKNFENHVLLMNISKQ